jgi:hypothetical protein
MDELVQQAREHLKESEDADAPIRALALEDLKFANGDQWGEQQKRIRHADGRPCLVHNRIRAVIKQITNEQRQQKPAILISPVGDGADEDTAKILQGIIRHIEYNSNADTAYDSAMEFAVTCGGPGWIRVLTDYCDEKSFDQEIFIRGVKNHFSVYADPACQESDYSDARYMIVIETLTKDQYKEQYPDSEVTTFIDLGNLGNCPPDWVNSDGVRIAEYWYIDSEQRELFKLMDGTSATVDDMPEGAVVAKDRAGKPISRKTDVKTVKWVKTNGVEVLDSGDWAGKFIPLVPVIGDEVIIDGKRELLGVVRDAKDPCRNYNYQISAQTEAIALAPRAPYVGTKKQFEGVENQWRTSNTRNYPFLTFNPDEKNPGPPQRQSFEPAIQAISMAIAQADNDIKATTGIYDASLGAPGPEQSGTAIMARQQQGSTANLHFSDNLGRALKHLGRILVDLIPKIYDTTRVVRIIGEDEQQKTAMIGDPQEAQNWQQGMQRVYDLNAGRYDVAVSMGGSYATRRQQAVDQLTQLVHAYPAFLQIAGPTILKNMDIPGAEELAKMAQKMLPPQLQEGGPQPPTPEMQAMAQQHQQLIQQLQQANQIIQSKKLELDSKERIASMQVWAQLSMAESKVSAQATLQMIAQEKEKLMQIQGMNHDIGLAQMDAQIQQHQSAHDAAMQASDQQFKSQQAQQQQAQQPAENNSQ